MMVNKFMRLLPPHLLIESRAVTYELRSGAIIWKNDNASECSGYAYPSYDSQSTSAPSISQVYYKRKSNIWIGRYVPSSDANTKDCCVPETVEITPISNGYGLKLAITKQSAGNNDGKGAKNCRFRKAGVNVHTLSALVPRSNDLEIMYVYQSHLNFV